MEKVGSVVCDGEVEEDTDDGGGLMETGEVRDQSNRKREGEEKGV